MASSFRALLRLLCLPCLLLLGVGACAHRLGYSVGDDVTPRASFGTGYVLAVAEFRDRRAHGGANPPNSSYQLLPDSKLKTVGPDVTEALVKHLRFSGLFKRVVYEHRDALAHLLLAGEVKRFRIYTKPIGGGYRETRTDLELLLALWRVDLRAPVWARPFTLDVSGKYRGELGEVTNQAFRHAMNELVFQLTHALSSKRTGPPHPPQER